MKMSILLPIFLTLSLMSANALAQKHQISFGSNYNVGWSGSATNADVSDDLDDYTIFENDLALNYFHRVMPRLQLGATFNTTTYESEIDFDNGPDIESETRITSIYFVGIYNFDDEISNAWYAGLSLGKDYVEEEVNNTEAEYDVTGATVLLGKRWALNGFGISNLTYSPMLSLTAGDVGGDLEDDGVDNIAEIKWDIIKLDLLF